MSLTPYMNLVLPDVSVTIGPLWATELNAALDLVDSHDHTPGKGAQITPAGFVMTEDLDFLNFSATDIYSVVLNNTAGTVAPGAVYRVGNDLWYTNGAGTPIQITAAGAVNAPGSGFISAYTPPSFPYTILSTDAQKILIIDTATAKTLNLPPATTAMWFGVKDGAGSAQTNNISIVPDGTDTIDGVNATYLINVNLACQNFVSDGISKWFIV